MFSEQSATQAFNRLRSGQVKIPFLVWLAAFAFGVFLAAGSLSYAPQGRINVLWVWLIWAGLPLVGSLVSLLGALFGSSRPWLFQWRWRQRTLSWYPTRQQRLHMLWLLQAVWLVVGLGILVGFWILLLFSDLAFGWSSTLVQDPALATQAAQWLAAPWRGVWPAAVPAADMVAATQFQRIAPSTADAALAGQWWRFLMASLLCYNLLPRLLLALLFYSRWRMQRRPDLEVRTSSNSAQPSSANNTAVEEQPLAEWQEAARLSWELQDDSAAASLGQQSWAQDEQQLEQLLQSQPQRLLWRVKASRSPVGELSDLINHARAAGVQQQALWAQEDPETDPERHLASWRAFAGQHQLVWITRN